MLFNIFILDWPPTAACKFVYADGMCLAAQSTDRTSIETLLTEDLSKVAEYCKAWRLKPNPTKTVVGYFHLANVKIKAHERSEMKLEGTVLKHKACPEYLGVTQCDPRPLTIL